MFPQVYFSITDSAFLAWLGVGLFFTAIVDTWTRHVSQRDLTLGEWFATTLAWPYFLWLARRPLFSLITGRP